MQSPYSSQDPLGGGSFSEGPQLAMPSLTPVVRWLLVANASLWALLFVVWLVDPGAPAAANVWLGIDPRAWKQLLIPIWQPAGTGARRMPAKGRPCQGISRFAYRTRQMPLSG